MRNGEARTAISPVGGPPSSLAKTSGSAPVSLNAIRQNTRFHPRIPCTMVSQPEFSQQFRAPKRHGFCEQRGGAWGNHEELINEMIGRLN